MKKILILIFGCILLSGCSYKELNDLAIVTSIGIDYVDDKYRVSLQIMDLQKSQGDQTSEKAVLYKASGPTIAEALRNIMEQYPRTIYLGHLELAVLGKDVIEKKTNDIFDYFISSPESSNDFTIFVNRKGTAEEIIDPNIVSSEDEENPTKDLLTSLKNVQNRQGTAYQVNFEEFLSTYLKKGKDPVVPVVEIKDQGNGDYSNVVITRMVPFKDNVLQEPLSNEQALALSTLNNTYFDVPVNAIYKDEMVALLMLNPKSGVDLKIEDGKVKVKIKVALEGHASEITSKVTLSKTEVAKELENIFEQKIKGYVLSLIDYCKDNDVDILGLKNMIYKHYNNKYDKYKDKNIYEIADIDIKVNIDMYRYGNAYIGVVKE